MTCGIYSITCEPTGRVYVGQSRNIEARWKYHRRDLNGGRSTSPVLQRAWTHHGQDAFAFNVIEECDPDELTVRELAHIQRLSASVREGGLNVADPTQNFAHLPEVRSKIRDTHVAAGRWKAYEVRGTTGTLKELSEHFGVTLDTLESRVNSRGLSIETALFAPAPRKSFEVNGEFDSLPNWCRRFNISYSKVRSRLKRGFALYEALTS